MIPITKIHASRVVDQIQANLVGLQRDMVANATIHKQMAQAQSPDVSTLTIQVHDCALAYLRRLQWLIDLRADATKRQRMLSIITAMGWSETDITDVATPLFQAARDLRDAPKTSFTEIITACDAVLAEVSMPDTLWPE